MAQNARTLAKRACCLAALIFTIPCLAAQAGEVHQHNVQVPIVLNGQLRTYDFTGGVGYGAYDAGYVQSSVYVSGGSGSAFSATGAFLAAARAQASGGASGGSSASAHAFAAASASGSGHR